MFAERTVRATRGPRLSSVIVGLDPGAHEPQAQALLCALDRRIEPDDDTE